VAHPLNASASALGVHLVADLELIHILRSHALSEARGCSPALVPFDSPPWSKSDSWQEPLLSVRQMGKSKVPAVCNIASGNLRHWAHTLQLLPLKPPPESNPNTKLALFFPKRKTDSLEQQFVRDLCSVLEACHLGSYTPEPDLCFPFLAHESNSAVPSWQFALDALRDRAEEFARTRLGEHDQLCLLVWPDEAWYLARSALSAFQVSGVSVSVSDILEI
jgi:hypothetical protein